MLCSVTTKTLAQAYPLDPLTATEMQKAVQVLRDEKLVTANTWYNIINLKEPLQKKKSWPGRLARLSAGKPSSASTTMQNPA